MKCGWSCMQTEQWETSNAAKKLTYVGSELPLTSFNVTHPGLAAVKVDVF